jgi:hypothetical protein
VCAGIVPNYGLIYPDTPTCVSANGQSTIDFFVVHGTLLGACGPAALVHHGSAPHIPITIHVASDVFAQPIDFVQRPSLSRSPHHVVGPKGTGSEVQHAIDTLNESLQSFAHQLQLGPDSLTRRAEPVEQTRLHALWNEFFRLLEPQLQSALGVDAKPQPGFTFKHGCLRDILSHKHANIPCATHALRWLRMLLLQAKALHTSWDPHTKQALNAIFNPGHLHTFVGT